MNKLEVEMVGLLKRLQEVYGAESVKAEFEAEGTRRDEALRLKDITSAAGIGITMKLGGGEAITDMYESQLLGVKRVVGPIIESAFALQRFLTAATKVFSRDDAIGVDLVINVESITGARAIREMAEIPMATQLNGVNVGRGDLAESMGKDRSQVEAEDVCEVARDVIQVAKKRGWDTVCGGNVSAATLPFLRSFPEGGLDRIDVRKVVFGYPAWMDPKAEEGLDEAARFEMLWLQNKRNYYQTIGAENRERLAVLEERFR